MSGASTLRNAVKRIAHKERSQPAARKKLGLLEKHKDYVERARDYQRKENYLKNLRSKARNKNPDEFYFQMNSSQVKKGIHTNIKNNTRADDALIPILKAQDAGYIAVKKSIDDSKARKLQANLHLIGEAPRNRHKIFVESEKELLSFDLAKHFDTPKELVDRQFNRPKKSTVQIMADRHASLDSSSAAMTTTTVGKKTAHEIEKQRKRSYTELAERTKRSNKLKQAYDALALKRALSQKSAKKIVVPAENPAKEKDKVVYKWKRQRVR